MTLIRPHIIAALLFLLPQNILAQENKNQFFDVELEDIFALVRNLIGLACVVFGTFFLLYKRCCQRIFLRRYRDAQIVTGVVVACTLNKNSSTSARYDVQVVFTYTPTYQTEYVRQPDVESYAGLSQEYMHVFTSYWMCPQGSKIDLHCIPNQPQSAITKEFLEEKRASFSWFFVVLVILPALALGGYLVSLCVKVIGEFPDTKHWVGWTTFGVCCFFITCFGWSTSDDAFCEHVNDTFLSAHPVYRRVTATRPPSTIMLTPPSSPGAHPPPGKARLGDPYAPHAEQSLGIQHCRSQSSLTTEND